MRISAAGPALIPKEGEEGRKESYWKGSSRSVFFRSRLGFSAMNVLIYTSRDVIPQQKSNAKEEDVADIIKHSSSVF
jgi:hypothetical protein